MMLLPREFGLPAIQQHRRSQLLDDVCEQVLGHVANQMSSDLSTIPICVIPFASVATCGPRGRTQLAWRDPDHDLAADAGMPRSHPLT
jgi:hypothetical protein